MALLEFPQVSDEMKAARDGSVLFVAPAFATDVRQQIMALAENLPVTVVGLAAIHREGLSYKALSLWDSCLGTTLRKRLSNFVVDEVPPKQLVSIAWPRLKEALLAPISKKLFKSPRCDRIGAALDRAGARSVRPECPAVMGREDAAEQTFLAARSLNIPRIYDQPTPHHETVRKLMAAEKLEFPLASQSQYDAIEWNASRTERKTREAMLASRVLVASDLTLQSMRDAGISSDVLTRIPYGCNPPISLNELPKKRPVVLYVGNVTLRKGIPRLLRVWKRLNASRTFTLRLVGKMDLPHKFLAEYVGSFEHIPWVPRSELSKHYSEARFLVFPAVADGFGMVINEALSHGLPIVASSNNGAPGFINHGQQGLIYEHGNDEQFCTMLEMMLSDEGLISTMAEEALVLAERWQWKDYRNRVSRVIAETIAKSAEIGSESSDS